MSGHEDIGLRHGLGTMETIVELEHQQSKDLLSELGLCIGLLLERTNERRLLMDSVELTCEIEARAGVPRESTLALWWRRCHGGR